MNTEIDDIIRNVKSEVKSIEVVKKLGFKQSFEMENKLKNSFDNEDFDIYIDDYKIGIIPYPHDPFIQNNSIPSKRYNGFAMIHGLINYETYGEDFFKDIMEVCLKHKKIYFKEK